MKIIEIIINLLIKLLKVFLPILIEHYNKPTEIHQIGGGKEAKKAVLEELQNQLNTYTKKPNGDK